MLKTKLIRVPSLVILFFAVAMGCSTVEKTGVPPEIETFPPDVATWPINSTLFANKDFTSIDLFLSRAVAENAAPNTSWWADYRRAQLWQQKDKNVSCENFARLASIPNFPLRRVAFLRAHEVCPADNQILARLEPFAELTFDPWLSRPALDVAIKEAKEARQHAKHIDLLIKKSKLPLRREEKVDLTQQALREARKHGTKQDVAEITKRLYSLSPRLRPHPRRDQYLDVADDFRFWREFGKARKYYRKIINNRHSSYADILAAYRGIRSSYRVEQNRRAALKATEALARFSSFLLKKSRKTRQDYQLFVDYHLLLTRNYWTDNQRKSAERTLKKIVKTAGKHVSMAEVAWIRGRMADEVGDNKTAMTQFDLALQDTHTSPAFHEKVSWYKAWSLRKAGQRSEAVDLLRELVKTTESPYDKGRYQFWLARTYKELDKKGKAEDVYEDLIDADPFSYYGLMSYRELERPLPTKKLKNENAEQVDVRHVPKQLRGLLDISYLDWLVAVREDLIARDYLNYVAGRLKKEIGKGSSTPVEPWVYLFHQYARSGNYQNLFAQLGSLDDEVRKTIMAEQISLLFPKPYNEYVASSANRFGISVEFIYSVMRQESAFNPLARSHMDAFGLMQLLPEVAKRSADANSIPFHEADDLYEPNINIPLGSAHLRELWDKYNGEFVLAVASYNASEKAILNWLKTRFRGDSLEFIEDIPYDETRDYVKLVMRNLVTYKMLNTSYADLEFPEWALQISSRQ